MAKLTLYHASPSRSSIVRWMLEEIGEPYDIHLLRLMEGDQQKPDYLAISPNNKMPAIVDPEGPDGAPISVFESGAILLYLGRKFGKFYPQDERGRVEVEQWLMWQMAGFGPMLGQNHHFALYAPEKIPYAIKRYQDETHRLYGVLEKQLAGKDYICGDYSIVDMACVGWARGWERQAIEAAEFPNVMAWIDRVSNRSAVAKALAITAPTPPSNLADDKDAQKVLFNQRGR